MTPAQQCQATKNKTAAAYAACRQNAEAKLATTLATPGDTAKYTAAIGKCETKFGSAWEKAIAKAAKKGGTCPDAPLTASKFQSVIDDHTDNVAIALGGGGLTDFVAELATCKGNPTTCQGDLATCNGGLTTCKGSLGSCTSGLTTCNGALTAAQNNLTTCNGSFSNSTSNLTTAQSSLSTCSTSLSSTQTSLTTCTGSLTTCSGSLATCNAGNAAAENVLSGKTFSSSAGHGVAGTMANVGKRIITPGTAAVTIAQGYHSGAGAVVGDADLVAGNIKIGVNIFGVAGTLGCGNGAINAGEQCDQSNLNGATCVTQGMVGGGTLRCGAGCTFDTSGCFAARFVDNNDFTVTDHLTGLQWEKKEGSDGTPNYLNPHDADNFYQWNPTFVNTTPDGTVFTDFLVRLNTGCVSSDDTALTGGFAGHCDWRLPTIVELKGIVDLSRTGCGSGSPCIDPIFGSPGAGDYWSVTTWATFLLDAWLVEFQNGANHQGGNTDLLRKNNSAKARAVRAGS